MAQGKGKWWGLSQDPTSKIWKIRFSCGTQRVQQSSGTKDRSEAAAFRDKLWSETYQTAKVGGVKGVRWSIAVVEYAKELQQRLRTFDERNLQLQRFTMALGGSDPYMSQVDDDLVADLMEKIKKEGKAIRFREHRVPYTGATLNRYWAALSAFLAWCSKRPRRWVTTLPQWDKQDEVTGEDRDIVWLRPEEWPRLRDVMVPHRRQLARFAINTGLRLKPLTHLSWSQINLDLEQPMAWVPPIFSKSKRVIPVPLNSEALEVIREQQRAKDRHEHWVFPYRSSTVHKLTNDAMRRELRVTGIDPRFTWHGFRHTWATWHIMGGTSSEVLMKLGGWHSLDMVLVYTHLAAAYTSKFADAPARVAQSAPNFGAILVQ